ncbi:terpene synthase family protein [Streptomyces spectabilis]|uniref:Terpene synthase n=1 Tax=Streptomyces spectabilis TaxID=68270 RepID=A0A7W8B6F5_STRST|nr:hypothetical protein [Streptomyces spectabilis]MBB5110030.1 hypothetical protein [Streptomyces spectabilis]
MNTPDQQPQTSGRICALAAQGARDLNRHRQARSRPLPHEVFDHGLLWSLALTSAFSGPWYSAPELATANLAALVAFEVDWVIEDLAMAELNAAIGYFSGVSRGARPRDGNEPGELLAALATALQSRDPMWQQELDLMLEAMRREREWRNQGILPSFPQYLENADNTGFRFVFAAHWAANGEAGPASAVTRAGTIVQQSIRLLNDLATFGRDRTTGDLNALLLIPDPAVVAQCLAELKEEAEPRLAHLPKETAQYMRRQRDFCEGFYSIGDFWFSHENRPAAASLASSDQ